MLFPNDPWLSLFLYACMVAAAVYLLGFAGITAGFWRGFLQAPPRPRACGSRHPHSWWVRCELPAGHTDQLCRHHDAGWSTAEAWPATWEATTRRAAGDAPLSALRLKLGELVGCANCCGFWAGLLLSFFLPLPVHGALFAPLFGGLFGMTAGAAAFGAMLAWRNYVAETYEGYQVPREDLAPLVGELGPRHENGIHDKYPHPSGGAVRVLRATPEPPDAA